MTNFPFMPVLMLAVAVFVLIARIVQKRRNRY